MSFNENKDIMVNIKWANQYTKYLKGDNIIIQ